MAEEIVRAGREGCEDWSRYGEDIPIEFESVAGSDKTATLLRGLDNEGTGREPGHDTVPGGEGAFAGPHVGWVFRDEESARGDY